MTIFAIFEHFGVPVSPKRGQFLQLMITYAVFSSFLLLSLLKFEPLLAVFLVEYFKMFILWLEDPLKMPPSRPRGVLPKLFLKFVQNNILEKVSENGDD